MDKTSLFTTEDLHSDTYRWRRAGKGTMVHIFYQTFQLDKVTASDSSQFRRTSVDKYGYVHDIDALYLKTFFEQDQEKYFPAGIKVSCKPLKTFDTTMECLTEMDTKATEYEGFDCFMFVFLTFAEVDGRLHFDDTNRDKGLIPMDRIIDVVKKLQVTREKPKIFIVQSDDLTLSREKVEIKGDGFLPKGVTIPTDVDRLIIQSTIPQITVKSRNINGEVREESLLVQAFVEAIRENNVAAERDDFLSLTTTINQKIKRMREEFNHIRKADMPVALVSSTLTKRLNFHDSETVM